LANGTPPLTVDRDIDDLMAEEAADIRRRAREGSIVFVSGNFNVLHPGHLRLLRFAAEAGNFLVVGVNRDGSPGVTVPGAMRLDALTSMAMPIHPVHLLEDAAAFIARLRPDIVVKGKEYETRANPEQSVVDRYGGRLVFSSGEATFSSISLLQQAYTETDFSTIRKPQAYPARHGFAFADLKTILGRIAGLRVLVVGDLIVDEYINCDALGMSQEDPTIVVTPIESKTFVGGAGIVAAHARGLGADVRFLSVTGEDAAASFAREALAAYGVQADLLPDGTRPTTRKQRFRASGKTLLRVNHLRQHAIGADIADRLVATLLPHLERTDLLLFSDFNYGCLPQPVVDAVIAHAGRWGIMMAADSQASSQLADISRFRGMTLITPTEREARLALRDFASGLAVLGDRLQQSAEAANVLITLGAEGLLIHAPKDGTFVTDRLPAFNTAPRDPAGAGDSLFTTTSLALCAGADIWSATYLGALSAACQVSRVGNTPLKRDELVTEIDQPETDR